MRLLDMKLTCQPQGCNIAVEAPGGGSCIVRTSGPEDREKKPPYMVVFSVRWRVYFVAVGFHLCKKTKRTMLRYGASVFRGKVLPDEEDSAALGEVSEEQCVLAAKLYWESPVVVPFALPSDHTHNSYLSSPEFQKKLCNLFLQHGHCAAEVKALPGVQVKKKLSNKQKRKQSWQEQKHLLRKMQDWKRHPAEPRWFLHRHAAPRKSCEASIAFDVIQDFLMDNPKSQVHIGVDSKRYGNNVVFAVAVVLYRPGMGGRVLSRLTTKAYPVQPETVDRLWEEVAEVMAVSEVIAKVCEPFTKTRNRIHVHLDLNTKDTAVSHKVYKPGMKWVKSMGFTVHGKPESWAASGIANRLTNQGHVYCC